jgi:hypothetical protein
VEFQYEKGDAVKINIPHELNHKYKDGYFIIESVFKVNGNEPHYTLEGVTDSSFHESWLSLIERVAEREDNYDPFNDGMGYMFGYPDDDDEEDEYIFFNEHEFIQEQETKKEKKQRKKETKKRKEGLRMDKYLDHYRFLSRMFVITGDEAYQIKANELLDQLKKGHKKISMSHYDVYRTSEKEGAE